MSPTSRCPSDDSLVLHTLYSLTRTTFYSVAFSWLAPLWCCTHTAPTLPYRLPACLPTQLGLSFLAYPVALYYTQSSDPGIVPKVRPHSHYSQPFSHFQSGGSWRSNARLVPRSRFGSPVHSCPVWRTQNTLQPHDLLNARMARKRVCETCMVRRECPRVPPR